MMKTVTIDNRIIWRSILLSHILPDFLIIYRIKISEYPVKVTLSHLLNMTINFLFPQSHYYFLIQFLTQIIGTSFSNQENKKILL